MTHQDDLDAPDLRFVAERLEAARPQLTALELDAAKQRIRARAATPARRRTMKGQPMKSRLAIIMVLCFGTLFSTAGAGLAITGAVHKNAAASEYKPNNGNGGVLGEQNNGGGGGNGGNNGGGVAGEQNTQPQRQVEAGAQGSGGSQLPFTGFAAIPVLIVGLALTGTGLVLRRRLATDER